MRHGVHTVFSASAACAGVVIASVLIHAAAAQDAPASAKQPSGESTVDERVASALKIGLPLVRKAAARYPEHRKCFSCHHQTLPILAITSARGAMESSGQEMLKAQAAFTQASFTKQIDDLRKGEGIGGKGLTVSYGLWTLQLADWKSDETTEAMVGYLLKTQNEQGYWDLHANRPPMEESTAWCAALAVTGLRAYCAEAQRVAAEAAIAKAAAWLRVVDVSSQEDRLAYLWTRYLLHVGDQEIEAARQAVLKVQHDDGGWSQIDSLASDAYATGQTLYILHESGMKPSEPAFQRGVEFLLNSRKEDGSWFVATRSKPVQVYFDNGDPHGKDQFISTPATCWALAALARVR